MAQLDNLFLLFMKGEGATMRLRAEECLVHMFASWPRGYGHQEDASEFISHFLRWLSTPGFANAWEKRFACGVDLLEPVMTEKGADRGPIPLTSDLYPKTSSRRRLPHREQRLQHTWLHWGATCSTNRKFFLR